MNKDYNVDYQLYQEIVDELFLPIQEEIDSNTKKHLYESKLIYLNHLRETIFCSINKKTPSNPFQTKDIKVVIEAVSVTRSFLKELYIEQLKKSLDLLSSKSH